MRDILFRLLLPMGLCGGVFCLLLWPLRPLLARLRAAWRKRLLLCAVLLFLLPLPLLSLAAPLGSSATLDSTLREAAPTAAVYQAGRALGRALEEPEPVALPEPDPPALAAPAKAPSPIRLITLAYCLGAGALPAYHLFRYLHLGRRLRQSCREADEALRGQYEELCGEMQLRRAPALCVSDTVPTPVLMGVWRPRILLPGTAAVGDELHYALRHELTHYRQRDLWLKYAMLVLCALHWYNPFVYLLRRELFDAMEQLCDEKVAEGLPFEQRKAYAATLLHFAGPAPAPLVSAFACPKNKLKKRMECVIHPANPSKLLRTLGILLPLMLAAVALLAGCSLVVGAATGDPSSSLVSSSLPGSLPASGLEPEDPASLPQSTPDASGEASLAPPYTSESDASVPDSSIPEAPDASLPSSSPNVEDPPPEPAPQAPADTQGLICPVPDATGCPRGLDGMHRGLDFSAPAGTSIYAAAAGDVLFAGWHYSYGYYVQLRHENGLLTLYAHCEALLVSEGQTVEQGEAIATVGNTGNSAGYNCHFEVLQDLGGGPLDPLDYIELPAGLLPPEK